MPLYTISESSSGPQVIHFHGRVTFGRETERCRQALKDALSRGERRFIFDLSDVEYVDSAGIGFLVSCLISLNNEGAKLRLAGPPERVQYVLGITKLYSVFTICPSVAKAQEGF
jgi:anti-sigma B factor antagonist